MTTPTAIAVYQASAEAQGAAALSILVSLLRTLAQKGTLSPDDVDAILDRAQEAHKGSTIIRRKDAMAVIGHMRELVE